MAATPERAPAESPAAPAKPTSATNPAAESASGSASEAESAPEAERLATTPPEATQEASDDAESTEPTATAGDEIVMSFTGPCWVDIRDSERKFKLFGEMSKGDRRVLEGTPPYSVILGNTAAVTITVAGAPFDLDGIARGNVARFTLDPTKLANEPPAGRP